MRPGLRLAVLMCGAFCWCGVAAAQQPNSAASKAAAGQATENSRVKIGVTDSAWDDIGSVLRALNVTFQTTATTTTPLADFNCLFVGCGTTEAGKFPAKDVRDYVQRGGVLYASDLAFPVLQQAFPEFVRDFQQGGQMGVFNCTVLDKKLAKDVGPQIALNFDTAGWAAPAQVNNVQVLVALQQGGGRVPVLIMFKFGRGKVVYTSFHNHANANELEQKLLRALVEAPLVEARDIQGEMRAGNDVKELEKLKKGAKASGAPAIKLTVQTAAKLSAEDLVAALSGAETSSQEAVLAELHDRKGGEATVALGEAISLVDESLKTKARELLVKRLTRLTAKSLTGYIAASNVEAEVRIAAARAAGDKDDPDLTGALITLLQDVNNRDLADASHASLTKITGQNQGPFVGSRTDQRFATAKKWKTWWESQKR